MATKILNTTLEEAIKRITNLKIQRLSVDLNCGTNLEILISPLGDNWEFNRMTGTDSKYVAIGIMGYGCYPFILNGEINAGYLATKLNLPFAEAEDLTNLLNEIKIKPYDQK
jgi:hypothetical protein